MTRVTKDILYHTTNHEKIAIADNSGDLSVATGKTLWCLRCCKRISIGRDNCGHPDHKLETAKREERIKTLIY